MKRDVQPEWLDRLPPQAPEAVRSRRDLRRVNAWMRNPVIRADALRRCARGGRVEALVDLGAGDGEAMLQVARALAGSWTNVRATLLDRQPVVTPRTLAGFAQLGWQARAVAGDVLDWSAGALNGVGGAVTANLFLHHFTDSQLRILFQVIATTAGLFVAVEPRRGWWPLFGSRWLWAIGCNAVTRHDASVSVRAGFVPGELPVLWPVPEDWELDERSSGLFSHVFTARRRR